MTTAEWYTPGYIVEAARQTMGSIDLDPASCAEANETVKAARYYTAEDDGLIQPWSGNVFINPPGGKLDGESLAKHFWRVLEYCWWNGTISQAVWVGYSLEQLQTLQGACAMCPLDCALCVPKRRIAFTGAGKSPSHGNFIAYLGPRKDEFRTAFSDIGAVRL